MHSAYCIVVFSLPVKPFIFWGLSILKTFKARKKHNTHKSKKKMGAQNIHDLSTLNSNKKALFPNNFCYFVGKKFLLWLFFVSFKFGAILCHPVSFPGRVGEGRKKSKLPKQYKLKYKNCYFRLLLEKTCCIQVYDCKQ